MPESTRRLNVEGEQGKAVIKFVGLLAKNRAAAKKSRTITDLITPALVDAAYEFIKAAGFSNRANAKQYLTGEMTEAAKDFANFASLDEPFALHLVGVFETELDKLELKRSQIDSGPGGKTNAGPPESGPHAVRSIQAAVSDRLSWRSPPADGQVPAADVASDVDVVANTIPAPNEEKPADADFAGATDEGEAAIATLDSAGLAKMGIGTEPADPESSRNLIKAIETFKNDLADHLEAGGRYDDEKIVEMAAYYVTHRIKAEEQEKFLQEVSGVIQENASKMESRLAVSMPKVIAFIVKVSARLAEMLSEYVAVTSSKTRPAPMAKRTSRGELEIGV